MLYLIIVNTINWWYELFCDILGIVITITFYLGIKMLSLTIYCVNILIDYYNKHK